MGPGAQRDTLDDFMGYWNYKKTLDFGDTLMKGMIEAIPEAILHRQAFDIFMDGVHKSHSTELSDWERMVLDFEMDNTKPDPYLVKEDKEHEHVKCGGVTLDTTPANFVISGLEIEELQYNIQLEAKKAKTPSQQVSLQQRHTSLLKKIQKFSESQQVFMPGLPPLLPAQNSLHPLFSESDQSLPENIQIQLPSTLTEAEWSKYCSHGITDLQDRLCEAYASESLSVFRWQLCVCMFTCKFKDQNALSQGSYTRMCTLSDEIEAKICSARDMYNITRAAMLSLQGPGEWETTYRILKAEDIVAVNERTLTQEEEDAWRRAQNMTGD
ncbi:hypothetical protein DXG01_007396 [Tephrocybe rancida]|nr:hypothetical protein DXG01_007396 [Tephrocybe rancida]